MTSFQRRCISAVLVAVGVTSILSLVAGSVRLLPWLLDAEVPMQLTLLFTAVLGLGALETALVIGIPCGVAFASHRLVALGEARALFGLGLSPGRLLMSIAPFVLIGALCASLVGWLGGSGRAEPGRLLQYLIDTSRGACDDHVPAVQRVPGTGFSWLCGPGASPLLVRSLDSPGRAWLAVRELILDENLSSATARHTQLIVAPPGDQPSFNIRSDVLTLRGLDLPNTAVPARGSAHRVLRAVTLFLATSLLALGLSRWVLRRGELGLVTCLGAALLTSGALRWVVALADRRADSALYPCLVLAVFLLCGLLNAGRLLRVLPRVTRILANSR